MGRKRKTAAVVALALTPAMGGLLLATEVPASLGASGTRALAELVARSPGARVGGTALKAKSPRLALVSPLGSEASPAGAKLPGVPLASVLSSSAGPEGPVPAAPGSFASDFAAPAIPGEGLLGPSAPSYPLPVDFGSVPGFSGGGAPFFGGVPGGIGGGGGGGGGFPGGGGVIGPPPAIPEPSTWLLLIGGFGLVGGSMRRKRRAVHA